MSLSSSIKIVEGRKIVEIRPSVGYDKGTILQKFISENNIQKMIYLGDDINDMHAFDQLNFLTRSKRVQGISVFVNSNEAPLYVKDAADFYVESVDQTYNFLKWLSEAI